MSKRFLTILGVVLFLGTNAYGQDTSKTVPSAGEAELDGVWDVERTIHEGKESPTATGFEYYRWRFDSKEQTHSTDWKKLSGESNVGQTVKFTLDETTTPKQLTI